MIAQPWRWKVEDKAKWLGLALIFKVLLFAYFAFQFNANWPAKDIQSRIVVFYQDSYTYYIPVEEWVDGKGYRGACRMPGFLPIYGPIYYCFGAEAGRVIMIVIQLLLDVLATYLLAKLAFKLSQSKRVFRWTFLLAAVSSFVSVWNNYAVSDSLAVSTLVFAFYALQSASISKRLSAYLLAGVFLCWSIFFRPVHLLALPVVALCIALHWRFQWRELLKAGIVCATPLVLAIGLWTYRNLSVYDKFIPLQEDPSVCYYNLQDYHIALRSNILAWGCDFQEWSVGTEFAWFINSTASAKCPIDSRVYTSQYNGDSLVVLKGLYQSALRAERENLPEFEALRQQVIKTSYRFRDAYKAEKPLDYWLISPMRLLRLFLFSGHLDNLPLPARQDMSTFQFLIKLAYLGLLIGVIIAGCLGAVYTLLKGSNVRDWLLAYPLFHILVLGAILGYAEQRYLTPAYPFLMVAATVGIERWLTRKQKKIAP